MIRKLLGVAVTLALPALLAAQVPAHRAARRQGEVVGLDNRPSWIAQPPVGRAAPAAPPTGTVPRAALPAQPPQKPTNPGRDRKSTRLNSSHGYISYAVFCLKKKIS